MPTLARPVSWQALATRTAISPRFAIRTLCTNPLLSALRSLVIAPRCGGLRVRSGLPRAGRRPGPGGQIQVPGSGMVPAVAAQLDVNRLPAVPVPQFHTCGPEPLVSPLHQSYQDGEQLGPLVGQPVLHPGALPRLPVGLAFDQ